MELELILHRAKLRSVLLRLARGDHQLVDDVWNSTLLKIWQYIRRNGGTNPPNRFVRVVGIHELYSSQRKRRPKTLPANFDGISDEDGPEESLERTERTALVRSAIDALPRRYQMPARLHFIDGLPCAEIATYTGRSTGTVKTWIHRARLLLSKQLRGQFGD